MKLKNKKLNILTNKNNKILFNSKNKYNHIKMNIKK